MRGTRTVELATRVGERCRALGRTVATAESCTGGLVAAALTDVPGSSEYVLGGLVTYADAAKTVLLDVPEALVAAHGAVSADVAAAMAQGARRRLGADLAVAVTGVAGPGGGTPDKPVGLTFIAVADADGVVGRGFAWTGDRTANRDSSVEAALELLLERLAGAAPARTVDARDDRR